MRTIKPLMAGAALACGLATVALPAAAQTYYTVNGYAAPYEWQVYMAQNGLPPGHYWLDEQGYWGMVGDAAWGNIYSGGGATQSGVMSAWGETYDNGSWSTYSPWAEYGVYGESNGCIYTADWSNC